MTDALVGIVKFMAGLTLIPLLAIIFLVSSAYLIHLIRMAFDD